MIWSDCDVTPTPMRASPNAEMSKYGGSELIVRFRNRAGMETTGPITLYRGDAQVAEHNGQLEIVYRPESQPPIKRRIRGIYPVVIGIFLSFACWFFIAMPAWMALQRRRSH